MRECFNPYSAEGYGAIDFDIDRARMQGKERVLPLSNRLLKELVGYWPRTVGFVACRSISIGWVQLRNGRHISGIAREQYVPVQGAFITGAPGNNLNIHGTPRDLQFTNGGPMRLFGGQRNRPLN